MEIKINRQIFQVPDGDHMNGKEIISLAGDDAHLDWVLWEVIPGHDDREIDVDDILLMPAGGYRRFFTSPRFITAG